MGGGKEEAVVVCTSGKHAATLESDDEVTLVKFLLLPSTAAAPNPTTLRQTTTTMSNGTHKKKQTSSRHNAHRLEAAAKAVSQVQKQKKAGKTRKALSRARMADMTAELDGQFAEAIHYGAQAQSQVRPRIMFIFFATPKV